MSLSRYVDIFILNDVAIRCFNMFSILTIFTLLTAAYLCYNVEN